MKTEITSLEKKNRKVDFKLHKVRIYLFEFI